eukprot:gene1015-3849_t
MLGNVSAYSATSPLHAARAQSSMVCTQRVAVPPANAAMPTTLDADFFGLPLPKGLLIDAAGTLISPSESMCDVYLRYGRKYGVTLSSQQVLCNFREAYNAPGTNACIRYEGDGKEFWKRVVAESVGTDNEALFEEIYKYYEKPEAWTLAPGSVTALNKLKRAGIKLAVVSNFDTRLRRILAGLHVDHLFDAICVSAEIGAEKPNPRIFEAALKQLGLEASEVVHFGDDRRNDVWGARDVGIIAWLWNVDVDSFEDVADRVITGRFYV